MCDHENLQYQRRDRRTSPTLASICIPPCRGRSPADNRGREKDGLMKAKKNYPMRITAQAISPDFHLSAFALTNRSFLSFHTLILASEFTLCIMIINTGIDLLVRYQYESTIRPKDRTSHLLNTMLTILILVDYGVLRDI